MSDIEKGLRSLNKKGTRYFWWGWGEKRGFKVGKAGPTPTEGSVVSVRPALCKRRSPELLVFIDKFNNNNKIMKTSQ